MFTTKYLYKLIVPLIIEQILAVTVGIVDTIMISVAGEAAVSGVSLVDMINVLIINIFAALATGGAVIASQFLGQKNKNKACESAGQLLIITFIISISIMSIVLVFKNGLLRLFFGAIEDDVMNSAIIYLTISALSYPFLALYNSCAALFRSMGNSKVSMFTSVLMNGINVIGNAIFIFGFNMTVSGVALASLISRVIASIIMVILLCNQKNIIHLNLKSKFHLNKDVIFKILNIGVPNGIENSIFQLGRVLVVSIISGFGTIQIAANAVANNIDSMGVIPGQALNLAMITVIGQCVGAGDYKQAKYYTKKLLKVTYIIMAVLNIFILIALPFILSIYNLSEKTIKLATILIFIHDGSAIILWPLSFTLPNALRAANDVKFTMITSIFSMMVFRIGFSYLFAIYFGLGAIGVWIAMIIDWIFRVICFVTRFIRGKWQLNKI